jgi:hypothetical protein
MGQSRKHAIVIGGSMGVHTDRRGRRGPRSHDRWHEAARRARVETLARHHTPSGTAQQFLCRYCTLEA